MGGGVCHECRCQADRKCGNCDNHFCSKHGTECDDCGNPRCSECLEVFEDGDAVCVSC